MVAVAARTQIALMAACRDAGCARAAWEMHRKLDTPGYRLGVSVLALPSGYRGWEAAHRTARKRRARAARLGYRFDQIDRSRHSDAIYAINTSMSERQGRPMAAGYLERHQYAPLPEQPCDLHRIYTYGVLRHGRLVAYLVLHRVGELALVSQILGHGAHLADDVMYLLVAGTIEDQLPIGGFVYYNRHDSGTSGLVYFKERLGFAATDVEWLL